MNFYSGIVLIGITMISPSVGRLMINREAYTSIVGYADSMRNYPAYDEPVSQF